MLTRPFITLYILSTFILLLSFKNSSLATYRCSSHRKSPLYHLDVKLELHLVEFEMM